LVLKLDPRRLFDSFHQRQNNNKKKRNSSNNISNRIDTPLPRDYSADKEIDDWSNQMKRRRRTTHTIHVMCVLYVYVRVCVCTYILYPTDMCYEPINRKGKIKSKWWWNWYKIIMILIPLFNGNYISLSAPHPRCPRPVSVFSFWLTTKRRWRRKMW
jgi:hypothetical protein